jgi:hypothetical protein
MRRIAFAVFAGMALGAVGAFAACPAGPAKPTTPTTRHTKPHPRADNCVNLNAVPQISATIVGAEPPPAVKTPVYGDPVSPAYQGPTLGLTKPDPGVRAAPVIGYKWSLE